MDIPASRAPGSRRPLLCAGAALILLAAAWRLMPLEATAAAASDDAPALAHNLLHGLPSAPISRNMPMQDVIAGMLTGHAPPSWSRDAAAGLWTACLALVFALGCLLHSPLCGGLAALLAAPAMPLGVNTMSCYAFFILIAANALAWAASSQRPRALLWLGLLLGLTFLQRSVLCLFPLALAGLVWVSRRGEEPVARRRGLLWLCLAPFLVLLPWIRMNWLVHHRFVPFEDMRADFNVITGALGSVATQEGDLGHLVVLDGQSPLAWAAGAVLAHPWTYICACGARLALVLGLHPFLFLLAALALWLFRKSAAFQAVGLLAVYYLGIHCLMPVKPSYFAALWPVLAALAAAPLAATLSPESPWGRSFCRGLAAACAGLLAALAACTLFVVTAYPGRAAAPDRLQALLAEHPDWACLRSEQGLRLLRQGRLTQAVAQLRAAQRLDPAKERELDLAWALLAEGGSGQTTIQRLDLAQEPGNAQARGRLLRMLGALQAGRFAEARSELAAARGLRLMMHDPAAMRRDQDRVLQARLLPSDFWSLGELLQPWPRARRADMLERFRTQLDPSSAEAERAARGLAQELLNGPAARAERAVRALLRQQQQSRSREPEAWLFWAAFAAKTGSRSAALQSLARLDSLRPSPGQWCEAASLYAGLGDERRARDILARAWPAASVQSSPDRLMQAALLSQRLGRDREALELFGRLVAAHPGSARYLSNRGVARARLGMKEQALADLRGAIALDPRLLQSSLSLGVLLSAMGRPEEARAVYDEALRVRDPADANVLPLLREARGRLPGGRD